MTVILRVLWRLVVGLFQPRASILQRSRLSLMPWPHEAGFTSMHNHVFFQLMEVGRWELLIRAGGMRLALQNRWWPVIAAQMIRYRRPVLRFQRFELFTQVVCWDEKDLFAEQTFEKNGTLLARGVVRLRFPAGKGTTSPVEIIRAVWNAESPPAPAWVAAWKAAEEAVAPHVPVARPGTRPSA